jgi:hypothetical protein
VSTRQETILGVLSYDEPLKKAEIVERTGFESKEISNDLNAMKNRGEVERRDGAWVLAGGASESKVHIHESRIVDDGCITPRKGKVAEKKAATRGRKAKKRPGPKTTRIEPEMGLNGRKMGRKGAKATRAPAAPNAAVEVAKFGEFTVVRTADLASLLSELSRWHSILVSAIA